MRLDLISRATIIGLNTNTVGLGGSHGGFLAYFVIIGHPEGVSRCTVTLYQLSVELSSHPIVWVVGLLCYVTINLGNIGLLCYVTINLWDIGWYITTNLRSTSFIR